MGILYAICCGLDVHKDSLTACLRRLGGGRHGTQELRTFGTTTGELLALLDWLVAAGCTHVAMESTGVYWKSHGPAAHRRPMKARVVGWPRAGSGCRSRPDWCPRARLGR